MSNILWKTFNICFSRFKCLPTITFSSPPPPPTPENDEEEEEEYRNRRNSSALIKNFNSLYDQNWNDFDVDCIPDFAPVLASQRFFFSSPGSSNAIIQPPEPPPRQAILGEGVAVQTYSVNPCAEFRKSMMEMIEARRLTDLEADIEFLHELLACYLNLNPKNTHKFILGAFSDVVASLMFPDQCSRLSPENPKPTALHAPPLSRR